MAAIFALLPEDLQIEVHQYNVEHRPMMKQVSEELILRPYRTVHEDHFYQVLNELDSEYNGRYNSLPFYYHMSDAILRLSTQQYFDKRRQSIRDIEKWLEETGTKLGSYISPKNVPSSLKLV
jgi:hypothetical protein